MRAELSTKDDTASCRDVAEGAVVRRSVLPRRLRNASARRACVSLGALIIVVEACGGPTQIACDPNPALAVRITDSTTGADIAAGALVFAQSASETDTVRVASDSLENLGEVPIGRAAGTYTIGVIKPRYQNWLQAGVVVAAGGPCASPVQKHIVAKLQGSQ